MTSRAIVLNLSLADAEKVREGLRQIGDVGARALERLEKAAERASKATREVPQATQAATRELAGLSGLFAALETPGGLLRAGGLPFLGPLAGVASVGGLAALTKGAFDAIGGLGELADAAGVSTDALQALEFAATQVGLKGEELQRGLAALTRRIADAASGTQDAEQAFRRLGIAFEDAQGRARPTEAVLADIAARIAAIESPAERAAIATAVFGDRLGQRLVPLLAQGREGLEGLTAQALQWGAVANAELIAKADAASDKLAALGAAFSRLGQRILAEAAPAVTEFLGLLERLAFGPPVAERVSDLEREIARLEALRARAVDGVVEVPRRRGGTARVGVAEIEAELGGLRAELERLRPEAERLQEEARRILNPEARGGEAEAAERRRRAEEDIARLRESYDRRLAIERQFREELARIDRARAAGAIDDAGRAELIAQAERKRAEALAALEPRVRANASAERDRVQALRDQLEVLAIADERERFIAARLVGVAERQREEARQLAGALFDLQQARQREAEALREAGELYERTRTPIERYAQALARLGELRGVLEARFGEQQASEIIARRAEALQRELEQAEAKTERVDDAVRQLGLTFQSAFEDAIVRGRGLREVLQGVLADIARLVIRRAVTEPLLGALGGALSGILGGEGSPFGFLFGGARAFGGPVEAGRAYLVGERGPELFLPTRPGRIEPEPMRLGPRIEIVINSPDADGFRRTRAQVAAAAAEALQRARR